MGYKRPVLKLVFADPEMDGLEVRARRPTIAGTLELTRLTNIQTLTEDNAEEVIGAMVKAIASALLSWNLEDEATDDDGNVIFSDDGEPVDVAVPCTADGLASQDFRFLMSIAMAILDASTGVSAPLGKTSSDGDPSLEASIPMAPISESHSN